MIYKKRNFLLFSILIYILLVASCGLIPPTPTMFPPDIKSLGESITLTHNTANDNDAFLGYIVYYKLYTTDSVEGGKNKIEESGDIDSLQDQDTLGLVNLLNRDFMRVKTYTKENDPVSGEEKYNEVQKNITIPINNKASQATYYINFDSVGGHISLTVGDGTVISYLARDTGKAGNKYTSFYAPLNNDYVSDNDINEMFKTGPDGDFPSEDNSYYLVFVALAYGETQDAERTRLYSLPATLSKLEAASFDITLQ